jgi:hypothetical protein
MVLIPEEKLMQYEQQKGSGLHPYINITPYTPSTGWSTPPTQQYGFGKKEEERELSDDIIVRGIPKTMRTRASALLERLKARPDVISWDDMGQVKIDGVFIPKSNISDLISSAMRSRKNFNPIGSQEFFNVLSNLNVPRDLVRNNESMNKRKITQKGGFGGGSLFEIGNSIMWLANKAAHKGERYMTNREKREKAKKERARRARKRKKQQKGRGEQKGGKNT